MLVTVFLIMRYYKKDVPQKVTFVHIFDKKLKDQNWKLHVTISEKDSDIFVGEYMIKGRRFSHTVKIPRGNYLGKFLISGPGVRKLVIKDLPAKKNSYTVHHSLNN